MPSYTKVSDLLSQPSQANRFLIPGLLPEKGKFIIAGRAKIGKSYLALELVSCLVRGTPFLGIFPMFKPRTVYMVQAEMPGGLFKDLRLRPLAKVCQNGALDRFYLEQTLDFRLGSAPDVQRLKTSLEQTNPDALVVDPLYAIHTGSFNEAGAVNETLRTLNFLVESTNTAVGMVAHFRKSFITYKGTKAPQDMEDILGSALFGGWPDMIITVTPTEPGEEGEYSQGRYISFWSRWLPSLGRIEADLQGGSPFYTVKEASWQLRILKELSSGKSTTASAMTKRANVDYKKAQAFLGQLERSGILVCKAGEYHFENI